MECNNRLFSLKKKEEEGDEGGEKKGFTKNVPLCNESDLQIDGVRTHAF
jgi:hypothetical protein